MSELFTPVRSMVVDGMPLFMASDVRRLLGIKCDLEVTPVVVAADGEVKTYQMVNLTSLVDALADDTPGDAFSDFLSFLFDEIGGGNESDPD